MKQIKILIFLLLLGVGSQAQFINTDSIKSYIDKHIRNNATTAFQNNRLNTALKGLAGLLDSLDAKIVGGVRTVDSLWKYNDSTLAFRIKGLTYTLSGLGGGSGGSFSGLAHDNTLIGLGTGTSPAKVDTTKIATKSFVLAQSDTIRVGKSLSIDSIAGKQAIVLKGDETTPSGNKYYGSNFSSVLGYHPLPPTNLGLQTSAFDLFINNTNGFGVSLPLVTSTYAGLMSPTMYATLNNATPIPRFLDSIEVVKAMTGGGGAPDSIYLVDKPYILRSDMTPAVNPAWLASIPIEKLSNLNLLVRADQIYPDPFFVGSIANSKVIGLAGLLAAKSDATHNHTLDGLSNMNTSAKVGNDMLRWNVASGKWDSFTPDYINLAAGDARYTQFGHVHDAAFITSGTFNAGRYGAASIPTSAIAASGGAASKVLSYANGWVDPGGVADGDKGDITISGTGSVFTIDPGVVTLAKMASIAPQSFIGRATAGTGVPEVLSMAQATLLINTFTSTLKGLAPASGGGTTNFLRADGTWVAPPVSGATDITITTVPTQVTVNSSTGIDGVIPAGNGTNAGVISAADWTTFNGKQAALVSGTNIKTINNTSLLGSGNIAVTAVPGGASSQVQFNNSGAFAGDAAFTFNPTSKLLTANTLSLNAGKTVENPGTVLLIPTMQTYGDFRHTLHQSYINPGGQRDAVYMWGYNQDGGGGRFNGAEPSLHWALESNYDPGTGSPNFEWHIQSSTGPAATPQTQRHMSMNINKGDGHSTMFFITSYLNMYKSGVGGNIDTLRPYVALRPDVFSFGASDEPATATYFTAGNGTEATTASLKIFALAGGQIDIMNSSGGPASGHSINFIGANKFTATSLAAGQPSPFTFNANVAVTGQYLFRIMQNGASVLNVGDNKVVQFSELSTGGAGGMRLGVIDQYGQLRAAGVGTGIAIDAAGIISATGGTPAYTDITSIPATSIIGRYAGTTGNAQRITIGSGLSLNATTGELTSTGGSPTYTSITSVPTASIIGRWSAATGNAERITIGSGLALNATTGELTSTGGATPTLQQVTTAGATTTTNVTLADVTISKATEVKLEMHNTNFGQGITFAFPSSLAYRVRAGEGNLGGYIQAFGSGNNPGVIYQAHIGSNTPTQSPFQFYAFKKDATTGRTSLAATEKAFSFFNGEFEDMLMEMYGDGLMKVDGIVHSMVGGFKFPDNTTQTTAASATPVYTSISSVPAATIVGRYTASTGNAQGITLGSGLSLDATTGVLTASSSAYAGETTTLITASYTVPTTLKIVNIVFSGATGQTLTLPTGAAADKQVIIFRNNSANTVTTSENIYESASSFSTSIAGNKTHKLIYSNTDSKWYSIPLF